MVGKILLSRHGTVPAAFIIIYFLVILFDTTSRIMGGCTNQRLAPPSGNLTPPRISPSCPHCLRLWLDSEYRMVVSLRNSLPELLLAGWGPLVTFLAVFHAEHPHR